MKFKINKAFTLPELIVVITILGTLATIGFVSYQGHSSNARDTSRMSDISNIVKQLELIKTKGEDIFAFVDNSNSTIQDNISISGYTGSTDLLGKYIAGDANLINLELAGGGFKDPLTGDMYKVGVTSFGRRYEVATSLEKDSEYGIFTAGTWLPRTSLETEIENDKIIGKIFYMSGSTKNDILLEVSDLVTVSGSTYQIKKIQLDRITLDKNIFPIGAKITLSSDESIHLIKNWNTDFPIEDEKGNDFSPYSLIQ